MHCHRSPSSTYHTHAHQTHLTHPSHIRFVQGWDEVCIEQLARAERVLPPGAAGAVLTTYPEGYEGEGAAASLPPDPQSVIM